jgi:hypothetical protein
MSTTYESLEDRADTDLYEEVESLIKKNPWAWQSVCAVLGLAGGIIAPILGAMADALTWFIGSKAVISNLNVLSIVSCALTLPLLILGACCLDLLESKTAQLSPPTRPLRDKSTHVTITMRIAGRNGKHLLNRTGALVLLLSLLALPASGYAQQTVFNVPTTDVLEPGKAKVGFGGYFYSKGVVAPDANRTGGQFTFEQPVTSKLNINADWFTGKHSNGLFTSGVAYKLTDKLTGVAAYSIGNANVTNENHFLYFEVGYDFN